MSSASNQVWREEAGKQVRTLQVVVAGLVTGCVVFLLTVLTLLPAANPPNPLQPISLTMIVCGFVAIELIAPVVIARGITAKARREVVDGTYKRVDPRQGDGQFSEATFLLSILQTKTVITAALFEGMAFFATIVYWFEGNPVAFGLAMLMIVCVSAQFPTRSRTIAWVKRQVEAIELEKVLHLRDGK